LTGPAMAEHSFGGNIWLNLLFPGSYI